VISNLQKDLIDTNLFEPNKYFGWYIKILESRMNNCPDGYSENHHVVPKSLGGSNAKSNLVRLTAREHFIVHMLLMKCMSTKDGQIKMIHAAHRLIHGNDQRYVYNSRLYEAVKTTYSEVVSEKFKSWWEAFTPEERSQMRSGENNPRYGKECPDNVKTAISKANKGKQPRLGIKHTEESIAKMRLACKNKNEGKRWYHSVELNKSTFAKECPDGWNPGRLPGQVKPTFGAKGKKWFYHPETRDTVQRRPGNEPEGYIPGRIMSK